MKRFAAVMLCLCAVGLAWSKDSVTVSANGHVVAIQNAQVRVTFDLATGTYDAIDKKTGEVCVRGAHCEIDGAASNTLGWLRTYVVRRAKGGKTLVVHSGPKAGPRLILEVTLADGKPVVVLAAGLDNVVGASKRVKDIHPLIGGLVYPGATMADPKTLNGDSGAIDTSVASGKFRKSANNLLLTFKDRGARRSLVAGGLTYHDYMKYVRLARPGGRREELSKWGAKVAAYLDCGEATSDGADGGPRLVQRSGQPYTFPDEDGKVPDWYTTIAFDSKEVAFDATGLDPSKSYVLGFSWWDENHDARVESVQVGDRVLLDRAHLPAFHVDDKLPEQRELPIPPEAYADGRMRIAFTNEAPVPNAVVSEVWLWEAKSPPSIAEPEEPQAYEELSLDLSAWDPVGRLVGPRETYVPDDKFYLDFVTADPFESLEQYGLALRDAMHARPNPYDFPTTCAWYVGLFNYPPAQNRPEKSLYGVAATPGLVGEMDWAVKSGFTNYSRAAMRLVPDTYSPDNEQGWWDDAHWRKFLHYAPPYDTSKLFGDAIRARGGLPFTYFQWVHDSRDFRQKHPEMMLAKDPSRTLDYTSHSAQEHMRKVFANLRQGGIAGMMWDYCDEAWGELSRGGFEDKHATAASAYRELFRLAKAGLGPKSWIHERALWAPGSDMTIGLADSQRTSGDTSGFSTQMLSRSGLRWYKNRIVYAYDMDSKDLRNAWKRPEGGDDREGLRMVLTMAYVAASRLLLATSYRDMTPETLHDLERTCPYPTEPRSARPVDAFTTGGWPMVYDYAINPRWHQLTLFNRNGWASGPDVKLSGDTAEGALGLDPAGEYYLYDFWHDELAARLKGAETLQAQLAVGEARMLSVHRVENNPQFLSTNRHIMQGLLDMAGEPKWDGQRLSGVSRVIGGETYKVVIAPNGYSPVGCDVSTGKGSIAPAAKDGLYVLSIDCPANATVRWSVTFKK